MSRQRGNETWLIYQKYINGYSIYDIACQHHTTAATIEKYIKRAKEEP